ncbi:MAG: hypothetical protein INH37_00520 [Myxococcaceae bacterium]|nr:hypothetical protein [Myxococcaceae bacterium]
MLFSKPTQYELWADLSLQNRHLRRNNWLHWGVHLVLVCLVALMAFRPLVAIRVDSLGRATMVEPVTAANAPGPEEAQHVSQLVAQYLLEVTSGAVQRDVGKALALMTLPFGQAYREKVKDDTALAALDKGNVRTVLTFDGETTEVKAQKDEAGRVVKYFVTQLARLDVYRADVLTSPVLSRPVVLRTTLLVVPRSRGTLNGLLVDFFEKEFLEERKAAPSLTTTPLPPQEKP